MCEIKKSEMDLIICVWGVIILFIKIKLKM